MRKGNIITDPKITLSESSFWNYFVPKIILECFYSKIEKTGGRTPITETMPYDHEQWVGATNLIMDLYPLVKPGICDSVLDNNNNIVNFSTSMEIPVVQNKISVKYYQI